MAIPPDPIDALVHDVDPEDDPLVGTCDVHVNNRGPFRIESPAHAIAELIAEAQEAGLRLSLPGLEFELRPSDRCRVVPSSLSAAEREEYFSERRRFFLSDEDYPEAALG